ncbi:Death-associated protein kinase 2 [Bagarius yarrelli]|uniref:Death-associated protein kinase 2 n=1 Tax=Bagarius yarrelli TaxID=175774 RepID=A0A556U8R9_BAGYA|nr:Death-associated protein kinase 2 [Bagarius yarrelli]
MALFKLDNVEDLYEIREVLGSGHFGQVREVCERATGTLWAGKFLKLRRGAGSRLGLERASVEKEVEILQSLQHQNIMALKDVFESKAEVVLIVELIRGGELFDFIAEKESLTETDAIDFLKQILEGVSYMHSKHIGHFDLKPENIMLSDKQVHNPNIKIIDFGMAHCFLQGEEYKSMGGTPQYIGSVVSMEISESSGSLTIRVNNKCRETGRENGLGFSVTFHKKMLSGLSPFQGETNEETLKNIIDLKYEFEPRYFNQTSSMAKDFIQKLLVKEQSERMTAEECLVHPWIKMSYNMVSACNRLCKLKLGCKSSALEKQQLRDCESDQEDTETKTTSLLRRRLSNSS